MNDNPPEIRENEELTDYASRLAAWTVEVPSDARFQQAALALINEVQKSAPVAQTATQIVDQVPNCGQAVGGGPGAWVYCGWCQHVDPVDHHLVWRAGTNER